jgi:predicted PolB exonuclease-like 3'-5' exonuclease
MRVLTLDIETAPGEPYDDVNMVRKPDGSDSSTWVAEPKFPPLPLHVPEVICWLNVESVAGKPTFEMTIYDRGAEMTEADALNLLARDLKSAGRLVSWNGRGFDMPLLNLRAMKFGVDWSFWEDRRHRFPNFKKPLFHYDMQDQLGDYGAARSIALDRTAKLIGLPGKVGIDGGEVKAALEAGDRRRVIAYCCNDVFETYMVYLAYANSHLGGGKHAQAVVDAAMEWAKSDRYLSEFYG